MADQPPPLPGDTVGIVFTRSIDYLRIVAPLIMAQRTVAHVDVSLHFVFHLIRALKFHHLGLRAHGVLGG